MVVQCSVIDCLNNRRKNRDIAYFTYPKDRVRRKAFLKAVGREDLISKLNDPKVSQQYRICEDHFEKSCIKYSKNGTVKYLFEDAFPTLKLPSYYGDDAEVEVKKEPEEHVECIAACALQYSENVPRDVKIEEDIIEIKEEPSINSNEGCSTWGQAPGGAGGPGHGPGRGAGGAARPGHFSVYTQTDLKDECRLCRGDRGDAACDDAIIGGCIRGVAKIKEALNAVFKDKRNYDTEFNMIALKIFLASPAAYRLLHRTLRLPSENDLLRTKIEVGTGLSDRATECLRAKVAHLSPAERRCAIYASEVALTRNLFYQIDRDKILGIHDVNDAQKTAPVSRGFVLIARGLFADWTQPLAFCCPERTEAYSADLGSWLDVVVGRALDVGYDVLALVADDGADLASVADFKSVGPTSPFFHVKGRKIYHFYDVAGLARRLRDALLEYDFVYDDGGGALLCASWPDLQMLHDVEESRPYRLAPALTARHVRPARADRRRARLAVETFDASVAAALAACAELQLLPDDVLGTAAFVRALAAALGVFAGPFAGAAPDLEKLDTFAALARSARAVRRSDGSSVTLRRCFANFEVTIGALLGLATDLRAVGHERLDAAKLTLGGAGRTLASLRRVGGPKRRPAARRAVRRAARRAPTAARLRAAFRRRFLAAVCAPARAAPRPDDLARLVAAVDSNSSLSKISALLDKKETPSLTIAVGATDHRLKLPEKNHLEFVCRFLLRKCRTADRRCPRLAQFVGGAPVPGWFQQFRRLVERMDEVLVSVFRSGEVLLPARVGARVLQLLEKVPFEERPCDCFPLAYLRRLFVRFRICHILKHNNERFKKKSIGSTKFEIPPLNACYPFPLPLQLFVYT